jgi:cellobiose phosphorylase
MYRLIVESLLGISLAGDRLTLAPRLPADWPGFGLDYRYRKTLYGITVSVGETDSLTLDGVAQEGGFITLADDEREHQVVLQVRR